ncbi:MAG: ATP-dependent helicase [Proteobacteria bacterium]|nr:ATP-dependent helicase [Pseudomonadota bacterium]
MLLPQIKSPFLLDYDGELNPQQLAVVKATGGPILVIAGAGSGKTRVVTYRVAYLIESGVDPSRILLLTFTNKAAREMLQRVELLVPNAGGAGGRVWGGTFHHIGNRILRRHAPLVGYQPNYSILDRDDAKKLMNSCLSDLKINPRKSRFPKGEVIGSLWGLAVNTRKPIAEIVLERVPYFHGFLDDIQAVVERYRNRKRELNVMDFDDLLFYWETLLREHPEVRKRYNEQFQHLLVDEYQDTNRLQADVLDLLAKQYGNIMVVGDDSQSIYSFRGANFANILTFPERYPGSKIYKLEVNYRSTPEILHLANTSIVHNRYQFPKELQTIRPPGSRPFLVPVQDIMEQASFVAQKLEEINQQGVPLAQMAVLYRAHYHSMELQMELSRRRIPYEVRSGLRFFEQAHIKDVSSYLKITSNPLDELAWKRVLLLYPKIGKSTAHKIWQMVLSGFLNPQTAMDAPEVLQKIPGRVRENWRLFSRTLSMLRDLEKTSGPGAMIERVLQEGYESYLQSKYPDYESRMDDLRQLAAFAYRYSSCQDFLSELALLTSLEGESTPVRGRDENGTVKLSSVHQAKGLEWSVVFIIWLAEGRFPSVRSLLESGGEGEEEERRLFYVAITRARDKLFLCYPRFAPDRGRRNMIQRPSRFIAELSGVGYERFAPEEDGDDQW